VVATAVLVQSAKCPTTTAFNVVGRLTMMPSRPVRVEAAGTLVQADVLTETVVGVPTSRIEDSTDRAGLEAAFTTSTLIAANTLPDTNNAPTNIKTRLSI